MRSWEEIRSEYNNLELMKRRGRAAFVLKVMAEMSCSFRSAAKNLGIAKTTLTGLVAYAGFLETSDTSTGSEIIFGSSNGQRSLRDILKRYKPNPEEVTDLVASGLKKHVAELASTAREAGRNEVLERTPSGDYKVSGTASSSSPSSERDTSHEPVLHEDVLGLLDYVNAHFKDEVDKYASSSNIRELDKASKILAACCDRLEVIVVMKLRIKEGK